MCRLQGAHDIIGDRAYSRDPATVIELGRATIEGYLDGGVLPVIKHMPGHGRAMADSHLALPRVTAAANELSTHDFVTFRSLNHAPIAMTAHVVFEAIDPQRPATTSPKVIRDIIRGEIGFEGLACQRRSLHVSARGTAERAHQGRVVCRLRHRASLQRQAAMR